MIMSQNSSSTEYIPMIEEVSIQNFKGIKNCEIKDMGKVNLFIGRNGCGKSSILEAIYFTGKEFIGSSLPLCIQRRANRGRAVSARELWYGYGLSSDVNVKLVFNEQNFVEMSIRFSPENRRVDVYFGGGGSTGYVKNEHLCQYGLSIFELVTGRSSLSILSPPHSEPIRQYFDSLVFVDPTIKTNVTQIEGNYLNILKLSEESSSDLAKRTSEIYETEPSWEFLPHPDFPPDRPSRFAILEGKRRLFFDNFGDGLHYGLAVMAVAKTRNNTALFIEEIESHQHPEAIENLVSNLIDIARINNLQLFITTHNPYVRRYLHYHYESPEERKKEFRCFHVVRDKDSGEVEAKIEEGILDITEDLHGRP